MRVCKYALKMAARRPLFFLIYAVGLSVMGVVMALAVTGAEPAGSLQDLVRPQLEWGLVDEDRSELVAGLIDSLGELGPRVEVAQDRLAQEEAVAQGSVDCLFIVPAGFEGAFLTAARAGESLPSVDAAYGFTGAGGALASAAAERWLASAALAAAAHPEASAAQVAEEATRAARKTASVELMATPDAAEASSANAFTFYLEWSIYTTVASIIACTAALFTTFNRTDVRRRDLASPLTYRSFTLQVALADLAVTLACWLASTAIGLLVFWQDALALGTIGLAFTLLASLAFMLFPLSVSFLAGQFGVSSQGANALGNLLGMAISFMGGAWISMTLLGPEIQAVARFTPGWWYTNALMSAQELAGSSDAAAVGSSILTDVGVVALFSVVLFCIALIAGKLREQTTCAGGNGAVQES